MLWCSIRNECKFIGTKYTTRGNNNLTTAGDYKIETKFGALSESNIHEDITKIVRGIKPEFDSIEPDRPKRTSTFKAKKAKKKGGK